jgi:hypothetical protein
VEGCRHVWMIKASNLGHANFILELALFYSVFPRRTEIQVGPGRLLCYSTIWRRIKLNNLWLSTTSTGKIEIIMKNISVPA